ncbi:MAG: hypothetical protein CSYNP_04338 [Syntrophus sp. SKADARSKE-3]|nr:hypothetical protein [Syntrophus sp. SKADARSKE-3]
MKRLEAAKAYQPAETPALDVPYDGLIIDAADQEFRPAFFSRIFTENQEVLYDPSKLAKDVFLAHGSGYYVNSVVDANKVLADMSVKNPLIVKAAGVVTATDVYVANEDAVKIYSADQKGHFLAASKVATVFTGTFERTAQKGDIRASMKAAESYYLGDVKPQDFAKAAKYYAQAAENNDAMGQNNLGVMFHQGQGVKQDYKAAASWYEKSAQQGYAKAQVNLATLYQNGWGVKKDAGEALKWFEEAKKQDYNMTDEALRTKYHNPVGLIQDREEAEKWQSRAKKLASEQPKKK